MNRSVLPQNPQGRSARSTASRSSFSLSTRTQSIAISMPRRRADGPLLPTRRGQDRDVRRAGVLGRRHDVDRGAEQDVLVAPDEQGLRADVLERLVDLGLEILGVDLL